MTIIHLFCCFILNAWCLTLPPFCNFDIFHSMNPALYRYFNMNLYGQTRLLAMKGGMRYELNCCCSRIAKESRAWLIITCATGKLSSANSTCPVAMFLICPINSSSHWMQPEGCAALPANAFISSQRQGIRSLHRKKVNRDLVYKSASLVLAMRSWFVTQQGPDNFTGPRSQNAAGSCCMPITARLQGPWQHNPAS